MIFVEYGVRAVGLFYALGAIFLIRQMAIGEVLDRAVSAIRREREASRVLVRRWLLGVGAALTGASGVAALLLSAWAVPLFAVNMVLQAGWLAWASTAFPPEDAEDALGRRRTFNAAFFYATVTVTVLALFWEGRLRPWGEMGTAVPVVGATLAYLVYLVRTLRFVLGGGPETEAHEELRQPVRIRFEVHPARFPIVDADDGRLLGHYEYLPHEMASRIESWHDDYAAYAAYAAAAGEGATMVFPSEEVEAEHRALAEQFVEQLRRIYGHDNVDGPVYLPRETWGEHR